MINKINKLKKNIYIIFTLLIIFPACKISDLNFFKKNEASLTTQIITTQKVKNVLKYANKNSLIIFDIDQTLLKEKLIDGKGKEHFFESGLYALMNDYIYKQYKSKIQKKLQTKNMEEKIKNYLSPIINNHMEKLWNILYPQIVHIPMEEKLPVLFNKLITKKIKYLAFTAREWKRNLSTLNELKSVGINIDKNPIYKKELIKKPYNNNYGYGYKNGILSIIRGKNFTKNTQKGKILLCFLKRIKFIPKNIIFIDNRIDNVKDVFTHISKENIPIIGLWYKYKGYIKNPKLKPQDIKIINEYLGINWWKIDKIQNFLKILKLKMII